MPIATAPLDGDVVAAIATFFKAGAGPTHSALSRALVGSGYSDDYQYQPDKIGPTKEQRIYKAFGEASRRPARARKLVEEVLGLLRQAGLIGASADEVSEDERRLRLALARSGWYLTDDGHLRAAAGVEVTTGGRPALDEQLDRLRRSTADPALLIGTAKELLESVAKFVLEENEMPVQATMDFNALFHIARERLGILPERVDRDVPGYEAIRAIHQSSWTIAENVNKLRNLQGTGHGRTLPNGVSEDLALLVVREACSVAEYMLKLLEQSHGRG